MILEILGGIIIAGALAYIFWEELKEWAISSFDCLLGEILAEYVVDAITGGLVVFIRIAGGFFKRSRYLKRVYAYFRQGWKKYSLERDEVVYKSDIPTEILEKLDDNVEIPVLRIEV